MKKLYAVLLILSTLMWVSCSDDDTPEEFDAPVVRLDWSFETIPSGGSGSIPFTITLDPKLNAEASWTLTTSGDIIATIGGATSGTTGSGTVNVDVEAGAPGEVSITLEVTNPPQDVTEGSSESTVGFEVE